MKENKVQSADLSVHDWYRFVLSFPPHLVKHYLEEFGADSSSLVLDPFCGTGTTNVECKKHGIPSWGIEAGPITCFASRTKCAWRQERFPALLRDAERIARKAQDTIRFQTEPRTLSPEQTALILKNSISPKPLSDTLILRDTILAAHSACQEYYLLALSKHIVCSYSNLKFSPEVGVSRKRKENVDVVSIWLSEVRRICADLESKQDLADIFAEITFGDARQIPDPPRSLCADMVITSPPYPNEKDYSRTTRLESVILGFIKNKQDLRQVKQKFIRSNTRNVYRNDSDGQYVSRIASVRALSEQIERTRVELGKTSGFERLYSSVVMLYFGGMARHLLSLRRVLKNGASLAYVVGDQASFFRIPIRTSALLGEIAESLGCYRVERIDPFRKRFATATGTWLNEEVLILKYREASHVSI